MTGKKTSNVESVVKASLGKKILIGILEFTIHQQGDIVVKFVIIVQLIRQTFLAMKNRIKKIDHWTSHVQSATKNIQQKWN